MTIIQCPICYFLWDSRFIFKNKGINQVSCPSCLVAILKRQKPITEKQQDPQISNTDDKITNDLEKESKK